MQRGFCWKEPAILHEAMLVCEALPYPSLAPGQAGTQGDGGGGNRLGATNRAELPARLKAGAILDSR